MPSSKSNPKHSPKHVVLNFEAIGTQWSIELFDQTQVSDALVRAITTRIGEFDKHYSRFRKNSLVTTMSKRRGDYTLPPDAKPMFDLYRDLYRLTGGAVTPLIGQTLADAGYDADYSLRPKHVTKPPSWDDALIYDFPTLRVKQPVLLDFGACGKGYLVDIVGDILTAHGSTSYLVNAGGDMIHRGSTPLHIGLEHPGNTKQIIGMVRLQNASLCGSAGNRRAWAQYHHIFDPRTLNSPTHIRAVWVYAEGTMLADALTTALYFTDAHTLREQYAFRYALVRNDYSLAYSNDFPAEFFTPETAA